MYNYDEVNTMRQYLIDKGVPIEDIFMDHAGFNTYSTMYRAKKIFDVKPILSDRCYLCHGPDDGTREAGLRFDTKEGAYAALGINKDRFAIVPNDTISSQLISRIHAIGTEKLMPPEDSNLSLNDYEKKVLTKWIQQGAVWKDHWAFVAPEKKEVPQINNTSLVANEVDHFIIQKLETLGLNPSEKALWLHITQPELIICEEEGTNAGVKTRFVVMPR